MRRLAVLLATGFQIGRLPVAPATWASLAVVLCLVPFADRLDPRLLGGVIVALIPVGIWASGEAERSLGVDARPIVIDEVVGMLIAVWGVPMGSRPVLVLTFAFFLFRALDIAKPFPIKGSQRLPGGWGVVADDVLAGAATNVILRVAVHWISP